MGIFKRINIIEIATVSHLNPKPRVNDILFPSSPVMLTNKDYRTCNIIVINNILNIEEINSKQK